ncbi:hypothetical protein Tco_0225205, partial [Tanacetum coccineum]
MFLYEVIPSMDVLYNDTYCASVEDITVQYCFFDILLTSLSPRNCIPPEVVLQVSMHSACSTSDNAVSSKPESFGYHSPMLMVPF